MPCFFLNYQITQYKHRNSTYPRLSNKLFFIYNIFIFYNILVLVKWLPFFNPNKNLLELNYDWDELHTEFLISSATIKQINFLPKFRLYPFSRLKWNLDKIVRYIDYIGDITGRKINPFRIKYKIYCIKQFLIGPIKFIKDLDTFKKLNKWFIFFLRSIIYHNYWLESRRAWFRRVNNLMWLTQNYSIININNILIFDGPYLDKIDFLHLEINFIHPININLIINFNKENKGIEPLFTTYIDHNFKIYIDYNNYKIMYVFNTRWADLIINALVRMLKKLPTSLGWSINSDSDLSKKMIHQLDKKDKGFVSKGIYYNNYVVVTYSKNTKNPKFLYYDNLEFIYSNKI